MLLGMNGEVQRILGRLFVGLQGERVLIAEDVGEAAFALLAKSLEMTPEACELRLRTIERACARQRVLHPGAGVWQWWPAGGRRV
jgi:hypothetical protein